jgi:hypothetical protein
MLGADMARLEDWQLRKWMAAGAPIAGRSDGGGLTFTLSKAGTAAWTLRYRFAGQHKELTLGRYPDLSLAEARRMADTERERVAVGFDVAADKAAARKATERRGRLASLERELAGCVSALETIRARLEWARAEIRRTGG